MKKWEIAVLLLLPPVLVFVHYILKYQFSIDLLIYLVVTALVFRFAYGAYLDSSQGGKKEAGRYGKQRFRYLLTFVIAIVLAVLILVVLTRIYPV
jgi:uncharacterized membrane protein YsdA (DUF1294 family)